MTFPTTALPVTVELALNADLTADPGTWSWTAITDYVRDSGRGSAIRCTVGRRDEASKVDAGTCSVKLDNRDGRFTPRNPLGAYYGQFGKNTPVRVRLKFTHDTFSRTTSSTWGTSDSGHTWVTSGGSASDFSTNGSTAAHSLGSVNALRNSLIDVNTKSGTAGVDITIPVLPTGAPITSWLVGRAVDLNNYYAAQLSIATSGVVTVNLFKRVGGTLNGMGGAVVGTHSAGDTWRVIFDVSGVGEANLQAKAWKPASESEPGWQIEASDTAITTGSMAGVLARLETGNANALPVVIRYDNFSVAINRFSGFVSSWPTRWDQSGNDSTVNIRAYGILGRLGQGTPPIQSPLRRQFSAELTNLLAYWPCEDEADSTQAASAISTVPPMGVVGSVEFAVSSVNESTAGTVRFGTKPMPSFVDGGGLIGSVPLGSSSPVGWSVGAFYFAADATADDVVQLRWTTGGTFVQWDLVQDRGGVDGTYLVAYNSSGAATVVWSSAFTFTGPAELIVSAVQSGGNISVTFKFDTFSDTTSVAGTLGYITKVGVNPNATNFTGERFMVGHLRVWDTHLVVPHSNTEIKANFGEAAHTRLARLCDEDGVVLSIPSVSAGFTTQMQSQPDGSSLALYRQSEEVDQGVLYEDGFGLGYLPRESRYNRPVDLALDFDLGHIAEPPEPVDDDQQLRNRWTVRRAGGSLAIAEDVGSISSVGLYEGSFDGYFYRDEVLSDHAAWRVHLGTVEEMRWPSIRLNLSAKPALIDGWLSCGIGSRITIANPPSQVIGETIDLIIEGYTETLGTRDWLVELNCSPASAWTVAEVDSDFRLDGEDSTLFASITSTATALGALGIWTSSAITPSDFPFDVVVGGERMTVTASGQLSAPPRGGFTVIRSVNGVVKAHAAGTPIHVYRPAIVAL